jgi:hypothetical protein
VSLACDLHGAGADDFQPLAGVGLGAVALLVCAAATAVYAAGKGWTTVIPAKAWVGGLARRHPHRRPRRAAALY